MSHLPAAPARWYDIKAAAASADPAAEAASVAEVYIYGNIGDRWDENGVIAADLVRALSALDVGTIDVRINSFGGSVPDGLAIFNALQRHPAAVNVHVDGVAVSCASLIAMAGDTLSMAENALMMIHAPWGHGSGNSASLREMADMLDKYASAMANCYANKTGKPYDECLALLSDGKDHWFTAAEAHAAGWIDQVGPAVQVAAALASSFDMTRYTQPSLSPRPAAAGHHPKQEPPMPGTAPASAPTPAARSKEQNEQLIAQFKPFASHAGVADLQLEILADPAVTVEAAGARLLAHIGKQAEPATPAGALPHIETLEDETDKFRAAASAALVARAGVAAADKKDISANPYRGYKLLDLARASLERAGVGVRGMSQMDVVAAAFTQSTSDFPVLLENAMHKSLLAGYGLRELAWRRFCKTGSVSDFRANLRYRAGSFGNLDSVSELGEFKNKSIPDGEKSSITAGTKGNIINLSRQMIINDDLGAFVGLAADLGAAAARTVEADVFALLAQNAGLGPTLGDGKTLFHSDHGNISATGAMAVAVLDDVRVKMASQKDISGNAYLNLRPDVLLCPMGLGGTARVINEAQYDTDSGSNKMPTIPNKVRGLYRDIVDAPQLAGTRFYSFADPLIAAVLEVAFLDGQETPYLESQDGFDVDGTRMKVRLDYGVGVIDYRGAVTSAGA